MTVYDLYERTKREIEGDTHRDHRKLANNTYGRIEDGVVYIRLHNTDIVTIWPGKVRYNTGGWFTVTTKERINRYTPDFIGVASEKGIWHVWQRGREWRKLSRFYDDIELVDQRDGTTNVHVPRLDDPDEPLRKALDRYVKLYTDERIAELVKQAVESGTNGDCLYCQMNVTQTGDDHLLVHIAEGYTMATLAANAVKAAGYKPDIYLGMFRPEYYQPGKNLFYGDVIRRSIRKYLKARVLNRGLVLPDLEEVA